MSRRTWRAVVTWARTGDWALEGVSVGLVIVAAVGFGSFAGRRAIVGALAEDFLRSRGVPSSVEVYDIDARGFVGRVRLGPEADPDFAAERMEVWLASPPPPEGPYALRPIAIVVRGPRLKARWTGERLSFGALDPLVREFLSRPPDPSKPSPRVTIDDGALRLLTPWGLVQASGDGVVEDSRLRSLDLALRPADLSGEGFAARLGGGAATVRVRGEVADLRVNVSAAELRSGEALIRDAVLRLDGQAPYPDTTARRLDGPARLTAALTARAAELGEAGVRGLDLRLALQGTVDGPYARPGYRGQADGLLRASSLRAGNAQAWGPRLAARFTRLSLQSSNRGWTGGSAVRATLAADRAASGSASLHKPAATLDSGGLLLSGGQRGLQARGPLRFGLEARELASGELSARSLRIAGSSGGALLRAGEGGVDVSGPLRATLGARSAALRGVARLEALNAQVSTGLQLLAGDAAPVSGRAMIGRLTVTATPATASDATLRFDGRAGGGVLALDGDLEARGALPAATARRIAADIPVLGDEPAYATALARALAGFRLEAPGLRLTGAADPRLVLTRPIRVRGDGGALVQLTPGPGGLAPLAAAGSFRLAANGGGLPALTADISRYRYDAGGFEADLRVRAALDAAVARGAVIEARGRAVSRNGAFTFAAADCVRLTATRIELGVNDLETLSTRLCPDAGGALIRTSGAGFRVRGRFDQAAVEAPFLQTRITAGRGTFEASGGPAGLLSVSARIDTAEALDTAPERRFHPVALGGVAALSEGRWTAGLDILDAPAGARLARASLVHDTASARGGVTVTAEGLRFTPDGLQPHDLSPATVGLVSAVDGALDFEGVMEWTDAGAVSRGVVSTEGLSFTSAAGRVTGLRSELQLSSLAPITAPPGQTLTAERVEAFSPLTEVTAVLGLTAEALQLQSASASFAGGRLTLEPLTVPLAESRTLAGAVRLDDVDLGAILEETGFADKVALDAVVDGRLPFQLGAGGLRFAGGELRSVRPGRLSVSRAALSQVGGSGGPEATPAVEGVRAAGPSPSAPAAPPNAFQDFAYQALENLAYDQLSVAVDSRAGGRLGMVFAVNGRHDPPVPETARIGLFDLLRGRAFEKRIPLPEGAPVKLTLDSSINFDELLAAYLELQRARNGERSAPVQPDPGKTEPS